MTSSGSSDFTATESSIIQDAFLLASAYDPEETLPAANYNIARRMLNMICKTLAVTANLWVTKDTAHTLVPGTQSYTVGTGLDISIARPGRLKAARRTASSVDIPLEVVSRQEYMDIPNKGLQAPPLIAYYDPLVANGVLYVWPTGSTGNTSITLTFQRYIEDFDAQGNTPDLPPEWHLALVYQLALVLAQSYMGKIPQELKMQADMILSAVSQNDEENMSMRFSVR
jgi:hypothetical protein